MSWELKRSWEEPVRANKRNTGRDRGGFGKREAARWAVMRILLIDPSSMWKTSRSERIGT